MQEEIISVGSADTATETQGMLPLSSFKCSDLVVNSLMPHTEREREKII